jgi:hypothetical protein
VHERTLLGFTDVDDARLAAMVADALGVADVELLSSRAVVAPYDLEALTTGGRYRVFGRARHAGGESGWSIFVKVVRSWRLSPTFMLVPEAHRESALAGFPFDSEPRVYRSDLANRLPAGLSMPRALAVIDLDSESIALWLEDVPIVPARWDGPALARAARLLGRLAASPRVRPLATVADPDRRRTVRYYAEGRLSHQVVPALHDDRIWRHSLLAAVFDDALRRDLVTAAAELPAFVAELEAAPHGVAHGDAVPRNLLVAADRPELVLIDFGMWTCAPIGFDLGQLLIGEVQLGERSAAELPANERACVSSYVAGLRDEGCDVAEAVVRRVAAVQMLLFAALPAVPVELLDEEPTPARAALCRERAAGARFVLDLVTATASASGA